MIRNKPRASLLIILSFLINTTTALAASSSGKSKHSALETSIETRVYIRPQCVITGERSEDKREFIGALAGIFLPVLIKSAFGGASSALRKAGSPQVLKDSGKLPTYLYRLTNKVTLDKDRKEVNKQTLSINPDLGCLLVVRGTFSGPDQKMTATAGDKSVSDENESSGRIPRLRQSNIPVSKVSLLFEAAITLSDDQSALHYSGRFLEVNQFQGSRSADSRGLVISLAINGTSAKEGDPTLSLAMINLGQVKKGTVWGPSEIGGKRTSWLGGIGVSEDAVKVLEKNDLTGEGSFMGLMPVTVEGSIAETEDGNKALLFIADVLDAVKDDVTNKVTAEATRDREEEAKDKAKESANAIETLMQEEESAYPVYLKAIRDLTSAGLAFPVPSESRLTLDQEVALAELQRTQRIWCRKFKALATLGATISRDRSSDCQ